MKRIVTKSFINMDILDMEIDDFDFIKEVDLCTDCYQELCDIIRYFIHEDMSR